MIRHLRYEQQRDIKYFSILILLICVFTVSGYSRFQLGNTFIWWVVQFIVVIYLFKLRRNIFIKNDKKIYSLLMYYLIYSSFQILRGAFIADNYWDWKNLIQHLFALLCPISAYIVINEKYFQIILIYYRKYALFLFLPLIFIVSTDSYGFFLFPVSFFMLFFPALPLKWKFINLVITFFILTIDLDARSNVIKFAVPLTCVFIYYIKISIISNFLEIIRKILMILPFILFFLAINNIFNIFQMDHYIKSDYNVKKINTNGEEEISDMKTDTRTFLYVEVLSSASKLNSWWFGVSPARGNVSETFGDEDYILTGRKERGGNEVGILNVFTWIGLFGVVLLFLIFNRASYLAVCRSNNFFVKIIGVYLSFRWAYFWAEDPNDSLNIPNLFLWLIVGFCMTETYRKKSDLEMKVWIQGIFL